MRAVLLLLVALVAVVAVPIMVMAARKERLLRDATLVTLGLMISGEPAADAIRRGWTVWRVYWGSGEYWIVDGPPDLDSRRRLFTNGRKLKMGDREPALTAYERAIEPYRYRT